MATQKCPRCKSSRIRQGYRPTPFFRKLIFRYNLLCNDCNWEFIGFAIPGTVSAKAKRKKKTDPFNEEQKPESDLNMVGEPPENLVEKVIADSNDQFVSSATELKRKNKVRKRVKIKLI
jgi:hypothetical protein